MGEKRTMGEKRNNGGENEQWGRRVSMEVKRNNGGKEKQWQRGGETGGRETLAWVISPTLVAKQYQCTT